MAFDIEIGAATVWMEASGEGPEGQAAVAHVLVNRVQSGKFGTTIAEVCMAPWQFSSWNVNDPNRRRLGRCSDDDPILLACKTAMAAAMNGASKDPTGGATFYFADTIEPPSWAASMRKTVQIGHQIFFAPS